MTATARITQADMERVTKSVKAAEFERARIVFDFAKCTAEVIIGESAGDEKPAFNPWKAEANEG